MRVVLWGFLETMGTFLGSPEYGPSYFGVYVEVPYFGNLTFMG